MYNKEYYEKKKKDLQVKMADLQSEVITGLIQIVENYKIDAVGLQQEYEALKEKENESKSEKT